MNTFQYTMTLIFSRTYALLQNQNCIFEYYNNNGDGAVTIVIIVEIKPKSTMSSEL